MIDPLVCDAFKRLKDGMLMMEVDGVRIFFKEEITPGIICDLTLRSTNYNLMCKIEYDVRKEKVVMVSCNGFKGDKVKAKIEESLRRAGMLYSSWGGEMF